MPRLLLLIFFTQFTLLPQMVVGYYYGNPSDYQHNLIEYNCLTHIAHAFIIPDSSGSFHYNSWFLYPDLIKSAHDNGKKIVVSIGGWGGSGGFKPMAADPEKRKLFISKFVDFIKLHGYDGADIDWEYPKTEDKENFNSLISEMRTAFDSAGIEILSAALPAIDWHNVFDVEFLKDKFDWFGIMTYDFYGPWEPKSGLNTALYSTDGQFLSIDSSMKHWKKKGVPEEKLCMGMEFAGYLFNTQGLYQSHKGANSIRYLDAFSKINSGWKYNWNEKARVPYLTIEDSLITIDDTSSIRYKSEYIVNNRLAGTIIWKVGLDYHKGYNEFLNIIGDNFLSVKPSGPLLREPANSRIISYKEIELKWDRPSAAGKYLVEISQDPDFTEIIYRAEISSQSLKIKNPEPYRKYYWRVRAENYSGEGDFSEVRSFFTYDKTAQSKIIYYAGGKEIIIFNIKNNNTSYKLFNIYGQEITIKTVWLDYEDMHLLLLKSDVLLSGDHYLLMNDGKELNGRKLTHGGKN